ncbi:hypothetical protein EOM09_05050 [bacterium]|nr:hypothetical protein [bacterium]
MEELKNIIDIIEKNGFEAYFVGGFVRDNLLKINTVNIDIATSALQKDILWMFPSAKEIKEYGAVKLQVGKYDVDITTYRKEGNFKDGKPTTLEYVSDLKTDLLRRDFTINALCYTKDLELVDLINGKKDLNLKTIRVIGDTKQKFDEDPLRILRALRFMTILDFNLDKNILEYLKNYPEKINEIKYEKRKMELDRIFNSKHIFKFIGICRKYNLERYLGIQFKSIIRTNNSIGIWSQVVYDEKYLLSRVEKEQIKKIREIVSSKKIDKFTVYKYGNYISVIAASILKKSPKRINKMYLNLPIKDISELDIKANEICLSLSLKPSKELGEIIKELEFLVVYGKIVNKKEELLKYLNQRKEK